MQNHNGKKRIGSFDAVKALAIYLVIWGHCILHLAPWDSKGDWVFVFINSFHMSLFMIVAGYFSVSALSLDFKPLIAKKTIELLLPSIIWGCVAAVVCITVLGQHLNVMGFVNHFLYGRLWFLKSLFLCYLFAFVLTRKGKHFLIIGIILLLVLTLYKVNRMFPAFMIGWAIRKYNLLDRMMKPLPVIMMLLVFVIFTILYNPYFLNAPNHMLSIIQECSIETWGLYFYKTLYMIMVGCSGALLIILTFYKYGKNVKDLICKVGQRTLGIYVIQSVLLEQIAKHYYTYNGGGILFDLIYAPLISVIITLLCYSITVLLERNRYTSILLLGKR